MANYKNEGLDKLDRLFLLDLSTAKDYQDCTNFSSSLVNFYHL